MSETVRKMENMSHKEMYCFLMDLFIAYLEKYNMIYCPNCGAKMDKGEMKK